MSARMNSSTTFAASLPMMEGIWIPIPCAMLLVRFCSLFRMVKLLCVSLIRSALKPVLPSCSRFLVSSAPIELSEFCSVFAIKKEKLRQKTTFTLLFETLFRLDGSAIFKFCESETFLERNSTLSGMTHEKSSSIFSFYPHRSNPPRVHRPGSFCRRCLDGKSRPQFAGPRRFARRKIWQLPKRWESILFFGSRKRPASSIKETREHHRFRKPRPRFVKSSSCPAGAVRGGFFFSNPERLLLHKAFLFSLPKHFCTAWHLRGAGIWPLWEQILRTASRRSPCSRPFSKIGGVILKPGVLLVDCLAVAELRFRSDPEKFPRNSRL